MKVLEAYWFTPMGGHTIGIVKVETEFSGIKFYIGNAPGIEMDSDAKEISERGAKFPYGAGLQLMP